MMENIENLKELKKFVDFMNEHDLEQLEIETEGKRIKLKKQSTAPLMVPPVPPGTPFAGASGGNEAGAGKPAHPAEHNGLEVTSPMVGTFYRASSPDAQPYVEKGHKVKKGDVVCIIEAMKLMNEIKSEFDGTVKEVFVENGEPVEFGQPLFLIAPA